MKNLILVLFLFNSFHNISYSDNLKQDSVKENNFPLHIGNKWQYLEHTKTSIGNSYRILDEYITNETIVNGFKYYKLNLYSPYYFIRFDEDENKLFILIDSISYLHIDFNVPNNINFNGISVNGSATSFYVWITNAILFGMNRKSKSYLQGSFGPRYHFVDSIGYHNKRALIGNHTEVNTNILHALVYDSLGNYKYYSEHYKAQINFEPFNNISINSNNIIEAEIKHGYNRRNTSLNNVTDAIIYIDSAVIEYYNSNDTLGITYKKVNGLRTALTYYYKFYLLLDTTLFAPGDTIKYRIITKDKSIIPEYTFKPSEGYYEAIVIQNTTNIENEIKNEKNFVLTQNHPNPFNPSTVISYQLPINGLVTLKVYDILGSEVVTLVNEFKEAGNYDVTFNSVESNINLQSGVYFYQLRSENFVETRKMLLIK